MFSKALAASVLTVALAAPIGALGLPPQSPAVAASAAAPASRFADLTGQYRNSNEPDVVTSVYSDGGKLYLEQERLAPIELVPTGAADTFTAGENGHASFTRDASGLVADLHTSGLDHGGSDAEHIATRFSSAPAPALIIPASTPAKRS